jgi:4-amino-4-deoxy-L-arabinose transferase-like glycosyltransferase
MIKNFTKLTENRYIAIGIFFLALSVYILGYTGNPKINDERALFSGIDSFIKRGNFKVNQIYWDYNNVAMETNDGEMVPNYEPAQMILAIPFYLWGRSFGAALQAVMFFNAVVTAASVAILYLCFLELGYQRRTSTLGALVYAFATLAWPYSRVFFREPLTVLAYLLMVYGLLRYYASVPRQLRWSVLVGTALGVALTTKQISVAVIPPLALLVIAYEWWRPMEDAEKSTLWKKRLRASLGFLIPLITILLLGKLYYWMTLRGVETFARNIIEFTTNPQISSSLPRRMLRASLGLTVSPYRGIFWYSPVLLLGLIGAMPFIRRWRWEGIAFLGIIALHILGYSRYLYWSGGFAWGSRYMLPIIPFLVLLAGPIWTWLIDRSYTGNSAKIWFAFYIPRIAVWLLIIWSSFVALLGILYDWRVYELPFLLEQAKIWGGIGEAIEANYMNVAVSPVIGHIKLLFAGTKPLDFAWIQRRPMGTSALVPQGLIISLALVGLALMVLIWLWRYPQRARVAAVSMTAVTILSASLLLMVYRYGDARFDPYDVDRFLRPLLKRLEDVPCGWHGCDQVLIVPDPTLTDYFLNYLRAPLVWYGIDYTPLNTRLMEQLMTRYRRIWLLRDRSAAADDAEGRRAVERYLTEHAFKLDEQQVENWARLMQFSSPGQLAEISEFMQSLGGITLIRASLSLERQSSSKNVNDESLHDGHVITHFGDVLQISLQWRIDAVIDANYTVFIQLLDDNGRLVAQIDRWPGDGMFPTASLQKGEIIIDNVAIPINVPVGHYHLITGLYRSDLPDLPRLRGSVGDFIKIAVIEVIP